MKAVTARIRSISGQDTLRLLKTRKSCASWRIRSRNPEDFLRRLEVSQAKERTEKSASTTLGVTSPSGYSRATAKVKSLAVALTARAMQRRDVSRSPNI